MARLHRVHIEILSLSLSMASQTTATPLPGQYRLIDGTRTHFEANKSTRWAELRLSTLSHAHLARKPSGDWTSLQAGGLRAR